MYFVDATPSSFNSTHNRIAKVDKNVFSKIAKTAMKFKDTGNSFTSKGFLVSFNKLVIFY